MTQQERHLKVAAEIDYYVLRDAFEVEALSDQQNYEDWYASLLSAIALLISTDKVVFAYTDFASGMSDFKLYVFTTKLVVVAEVDPAADAVPVVQAVSRRSLKSMKLSAADRIDAREGRSHEWPGALSLVLTFRDLLKPVEIVGDGKNPLDIKQPSALVNLIEGLSSDLAD